MEYRQPGKSALYISPLCVDCWTFAGNGWSKQPEVDSIATAHGASPAQVLPIRRANQIGLTA